MAEGNNPNFKPIYKTDYNSQNALFNFHFPDELAEITYYMKMIFLGEMIGIELAYAWLKTNTPPYEKYFKDYEDIIKKLKTCDAGIIDWKQHHRNEKPLFLINLVDEIYQQWWRAFNESGAGIRGSVYVPFDTRVKNAVRNL